MIYGNEALSPFDQLHYVQGEVQWQVSCSCTYASVFRLISNTLIDFVRFYGAFLHGFFYYRADIIAVIVLISLLL